MTSQAWFVVENMLLSMASVQKELRKRDDRRFLNNMDDKSIAAASKLIPASYVKQGMQSINSRGHLISQLLEQRKLPEIGWDSLTIELLLQHFAMMDSNNFPGNCGLGEREGRVFSNLINQRHFRLSHGIGRSGDVTEVQPKAAGSSLMNKITNELVLDLIKLCGVRNASAAFVIPMATGMSLTLCFLTLRHCRPNSQYIIWSRIDQKSCFKSMITAGFKPLIVEGLIDGDEIQTNILEIERIIVEKGAENILCVMTTTSCFAPRGPDKLEEVATICKSHNVPHIVNNAYGMQVSKCMHLVEQASRKGRVDAFVQSTDKNLLVPVGGSIIAGFDKVFIEKISQLYPGRASSSACVDVLVTLLELGSEGYKRLLNERKEAFSYLKERLEVVSAKYNERILNTPNNKISLAMTVSSDDACKAQNGVRHLGSMLFTRFVSGTRYVSSNGVKDVESYSFIGFGSHHSRYSTAYLTAAAAIGITKKDVDIFIKRLEESMKKYKKKPKKLHNGVISNGEL